MGRHILALVAIFVGVSIAWIILGNTVQVRTSNQDERQHFANQEDRNG
ncbi:hypothetical protein ACP3TJ_02050 [Desulforudis sp. 1088]